MRQGTWKKVTSALAAVALALTISACTSDNPDDTGGDGTTATTQPTGTTAAG
jgi:hypothetical protein